MFGRGSYIAEDLREEVSTLLYRYILAIDIIYVAFIENTLACPTVASKTERSNHVLHKHAFRPTA